MDGSGGIACGQPTASRVIWTARAGGANRSSRLHAVRVARTKAVLGFIAGAYGAGRIRRGIVPHAKHQTLVERDKMAISLPDQRSAGYSHTRAHADRRSGWGHVRQGKSMPSPTTNRPAANDHCAAAAGTPDQRQAEYFVRLLTQRRQLIDHRIDKYQKAIAIAEASGDVENVRGFRRTTRIEEQDRQTVEDLIENLRRRFPPISRRAR